MSTQKARIALAVAERLAAELVELLAPVCDRLEIAGSIRRRRPDVGDVEICAIARRTSAPELDMFGEPTGATTTVNHLSELTDMLLEEGILEHRLDINGRRAWGESYRRTMFQGFALDLFSCLPEQWGVLLTLRTGPAMFSHRLVTDTTQRLEGGLYGLKQPWAQVKGLRVLHRESGEALETPEELDVFIALNLPYPEPSARVDDWKPW